MQQAFATQRRGNTAAAPRAAAGAIDAGVKRAKWFSHSKTRAGISEWLKKKRGEKAIIKEEVVVAMGHIIFVETFAIGEKERHWEVPYASDSSEVDENLRDQICNRLDREIIGAARKIICPMDLSDALRCMYDQEKPPEAVSRNLLEGFKVVKITA